MLSLWNPELHPDDCGTKDGGTDDDGTDGDCHYDGTDGYRYYAGTYYGS